MKTGLFVTAMLTLSCGMTDGAGEGDATAPAPEAVTPTETVAVVQGHPTRASTPEACAACQGDWGIHGLSETESCICRTNDGGKRCTDGADCEGICLADADHAEYELVGPGAPGYGFLVGRCSAVFPVFDCFAVVEVGARDAPPVPIGEPPPVICVD